MNKFLIRYNYFCAFLNIYLLTFCLTAAFLSGCSSTPVKQVVEKEVYKSLDIPSTLLVKCSISQPPDKTEYLDSNFEKKETLLTNYSIDLHRDLVVCNEQIRKIRKLTEDQKALLEKLNGEK